MVANPSGVSYQTIQVESGDGRYRIAFDRDDKPNPIGDLTLSELEEALTAVEGASDARVLTITGRGGSFATGADLDELSGWWSERRWDRIMQFVRHGQEVLNRLDGLGMPTVAAIDGHALGGGLEVALACDFRFATPDSQLGLPEIDLGMLPAWGGLHRLPQLVGQNTAKDLLLTGRRVDGVEAAELGLVDTVPEDGDLEAAVDRYASVLAEKPPVTTEYLLEVLRAGEEGATAGGLANELVYDMLSIFTDEAQRRTREFFDGD